MTALSSLTNRIFLASAVLVVVSMGIAIYWVSDSVARQAERDLQAGLAEAASLVDQFSQRDFEDFVAKGRFIADIPPMRAAAAIDHPPTVQPIARGDAGPHRRRPAGGRLAAAIACSPVPAACTWMTRRSRGFWRRVGRRETARSSGRSRAASCTSPPSRSIRCARWSLVSASIATSRCRSSGSPTATSRSSPVRRSSPRRSTPQCGSGVGVGRDPT